MANDMRNLRRYVSASAALGMMVVALGSIALLVAPVAAEPGASQSLAAHAATANQVATPVATISAADRARTGVDALSAPANQSATVTATSSLTGSVVLTPAATTTATNAVTLAQPAAAPTAVPAITGLAAITEEASLEGTVIANLSPFPAKFFVSGALYSLPPRLSAGLDLPRSAEMLMLYTCSADAPDPSGLCFWDAYLLQQGLLYEVRPAGEADAGAALLLTSAAPPPNDQVWVQNRTGRAESVVYRDQTYEITPAGVQDFPVAPDAPGVLYVRSCVNMGDDAVCEWSPKSLQPGSFYAMQASTAAGAEPGSTVTTIELRPIMNEAAAQAPATAAAEPGVTCTLEVPAVNIRSGPGLQYEIVGKVRSTPQAPGTLVVTGHSPDQLWYTVADEVSPGGWVTSSSNFIACTGDLAALPEVNYTGPAIAAVPTPVPTAAPGNSDASDEPTVAPAEPVTDEPETPPAEDATATEDASSEVTPTLEAETGPAVPPGQALLVVNNGFMHQMRFTIDQRYRPEEGPSEFDLEPGQSVAVVVFPGQVAFTASSAWNGLSGNADLYVEPDQAVPLWLRFEQDANDTEWNLYWQ